MKKKSRYTPALIIVFPKSYFTKNFLVTRNERSTKLFTLLCHDLIVGGSVKPGCDYSIETSNAYSARSEHPTHGPIG